MISTGGDAQGPIVILVPQSGQCQDAIVHSAITTTPSFIIAVPQTIDTSLVALDSGANSFIDNFQCPTTLDSTISCIRNSSALMDPQTHHLSTIPVAAPTLFYDPNGQHLISNLTGHAQRSQSTLPSTYMQPNQTSVSGPKSPDYRNTPQLRLLQNSQIMNMHGFRCGPGSTVNIPSASALPSLTSPSTGLLRGDSPSRLAPISKAIINIPAALPLRSLDLPPEVVINDSQITQSSSAKTWYGTCLHTLNFLRFLRTLNHVLWTRTLNTYSESVHEL